MRLTSLRRRNVREDALPEPADATLGFGVAFAAAVREPRLVRLHHSRPQSRGGVGMQVGADALGGAPDAVVDKGRQLLQPKVLEQHGLHERLDARCRTGECAPRGTDVELRRRGRQEHPKALPTGGDDDGLLSLGFGRILQQHGLSMALCKGGKAHENLIQSGGFRVQVAAQLHFFLLGERLGIQIDGVHRQMHRPGVGRIRKGRLEHHGARIHQIVLHKGTRVVLCVLWQDPRRPLVTQRRLQLLADANAHLKGLGSSVVLVGVVIQRQFRGRRTRGPLNRRHHHHPASLLRFHIMIVFHLSLR